MSTINGRNAIAEEYDIVTWSETMCFTNKCDLFSLKCKLLKFNIFCL